MAIRRKIPITASELRNMATRFAGIAETLGGLAQQLEDHGIDSVAAQAQKIRELIDPTIQEDTRVMSLIRYVRNLKMACEAAVDRKMAEDAPQRIQALLEQSAKREAG